MGIGTVPAEGGRLLREELGGLVWTTGTVHVDRRCGGEPGERLRVV
jgi:hypothetical protein